MVTVKQMYRSKDLHFSHKISYQPASVKADTHTYWELLLIKQGQGIYTVNGKEYSFAQNHLIITRPMDPHAIALQDDVPYERYNFTFVRNPAYEDLLDALMPDVDVINCGDNELLCDLFYKNAHYLEQYKQENLEENTVETLLIQTVYEILCNLLILSRQEDTSKPDTRNPLVSQAVQYINEHIAEVIHVSDLAAHLSVSGRYLEKLFTAYLHITPKQYILTRKLILARQDLRAGSTAAEVCERYCFADYSGFYRQYVKHFGHKPSNAAKMGSHFKIDM